MRNNINKCRHTKMSALSVHGQWNYLIDISCGIKFYLHVWWIFDRVILSCKLNIQKSQMIVAFYNVKSFSAILWWEHVTSWRDNDDDVCLVQDQHGLVAFLLCYSMRQQSTGRHVPPIFYNTAVKKSNTYVSSIGDIYDIQCTSILTAGICNLHLRGTRIIPYIPSPPPPYLICTIVSKLPQIE